MMILGFFGVSAICGKYLGTGISGLVFFGGWREPSPWFFVAFLVFLVVFTVGFCNMHFEESTMGT